MFDRMMHPVCRQAYSTRGGVTNDDSEVTPSV
jgi:hypothetical protein